MEAGGGEIKRKGRRERERISLFLFQRRGDLNIDWRDCEAGGFPASEDSKQHNSLADKNEAELTRNPGGL